MEFPYLPFAKCCNNPSKLNQPVKVPTYPLQQARDYNVYSKRPTSLASPAAQVFSVDIHTDCDDDVERPCSIYGSIQAVEERGRTFSIYDRGTDDPEMILKQGSLSLINSFRTFITCSLETTTKLDLCLKDTTRGIEIIKAQHILHSKAQDIEETSDKLIKALIPGQHDFAYVYYTIFHFAVVATVACEITEKYDSDCPSSNIFGSIIAEYSNSKQYCGHEGDVKYMKTTLFSMNSDNSVETAVGESINLSRFCIVVPAYAVLKIEADLCDCRGPFARGSLEFIARDRGDIKKYIYGESGVMLVRVSWDHTFSLLYEDKLPRTYFEPRSDIDWRKRGGGFNFPEAYRMNALQKCIVSSDQQWGNPAFSPFGSVHSCMSTSSDREQMPMLEMFSVYDAGFTRKISALCGRIRLYGYSHFDGLNIYERNLSNPEFLSADNIITTVEGHSDLDDQGVLATLHLKDPICDLHICEGEVSWRLEDYYESRLYDRRLCSVFPGKDGYVAVHFMIFEEACLANVKITFFTCNIVAAYVYGTIYASYSNHEYSSAYEKKYYRSRLFNKAVGEAVELSTRSSLPLSKSVVPLPPSSLLIVEADLRAVCNGDPEEEALLCGTATFDIDLSKNSLKQIQGLHYCIQVAVDFEEIDF